MRADGRRCLLAAAALEFVDHLRRGERVAPEPRPEPWQRSQDLLASRHRRRASPSRCSELGSSAWRIGRRIASTTSTPRAGSRILDGAQIFEQRWGWLGDRGSGAPRHCPRTSRLHRAAVGCPQHPSTEVTYAPAAMMNTTGDFADVAQRLRHTQAMPPSVFAWHRLPHSPTSQRHTLRPSPTDPGSAARAGVTASRFMHCGVAIRVGPATHRYRALCGRRKWPER
jgi:hypothetical protein